MGKAFQQTIDDFRSSRGVLCLSAICNDILMWSHYTQSHTGVCLKFDTGSDFFRFAQKVKYRTACPLVWQHLSEAVSMQGGDKNRAERKLLSKLFFTKAKQWEYESEWRILSESLGHAKPGVLTFPAKSLVGIILGSRTGEIEREKVRDYLQKSECKPEKIYRAQVSKTRFALRIQEIP